MPSRIALAAVATGLVLSWAGHAEAAGGGGKAQLAFDLDWVSGEQNDDTASGAGGALRLGYEIDLALFSLIPEIGGSYHSFSDLETSVFRGIAGGRMRFLKVLEPGVYAHVGVGRADSDRALVPSWTGASADGGVLLDFTLLPVLELGGHAGYNVLWGEGAIEALGWWNAGLHAALIL